MYAEERQQAMAALVTRRGRLSVADLADEYDVTTETVRRDLSSLERAGVLRRVHGGAVPAAALSALEIAVHDRDHSQTAQKEAIALAAQQFLPRAGGSILLDAGTTTSRLAAALPHDLRLTAFTNAVPIAGRLAGQPGIELHLLPGRVRSTTQAAVGEETVAALHDVRVDVAFVGTNGITPGHGLTTPDRSEAAAKRAMIASAHRVVVLADSSKIGRENTVRFAGCADIDVLVTDAQIDDRDRHALADTGIEVVVA